MNFILFAKAPIIGTLKTRLGNSIGQKLATQFATAMLQDTVEVIRGAGQHVILCTPQPTHDHHVTVDAIWDQGEGNLGERIDRALLRSNGPAVVIGADAPGWPQPLLAELISSCQQTATLTPSSDGGFSAIGGPNWHTGLLNTNVRWSCAHTLEDVERRLIARGFFVHKTAPWDDIDYEADLRKFLKSSHIKRAPNTESLACEL